MSLPWFRLYAEFASDPVIQSLAFEDQRHFVVLLCLKCSGVLDRAIPKANKDRIILRTLGLDSKAGDEVKRRLQEINLIDQTWQIVAWEKRQFKSDHSHERVSKLRKNKKVGNGVVTESDRYCNASDTDTDTDTDIPPKSPVNGGRFDGLKWLIDRGVDKTVAADWLKVRKTKRAANTETAFEALQREADKAGLSLEQAVRIAAESSWQGFKAAWFDGKPTKEMPFR